jgi:hypothetical protein
MYGSIRTTGRAGNLTHANRPNRGCGDERVDVLKNREGVALPHDLQLHGSGPAPDPHHQGHRRGEAGILTGTRDIPLRQPATSRGG